MEYTNRGFGTTSGFKTKRYGEVTVRESSNAMGPHLWIFGEKDPLNSKRKEEGSAIAMELTLEEAKMLRYDLDKMIGHLKESWGPEHEWTDEDAEA